MLVRTYGKNIHQSKCHRTTNTWTNSSASNSAYVGSCVSRQPLCQAICQNCLSFFQSPLMVETAWSKVVYRIIKFISVWAMPLWFASCWHPVTSFSLFEGMGSWHPAHALQFPPEVNYYAFGCLDQVPCFLSGAIAVPALRQVAKPYGGKLTLGVGKLTRCGTNPAWRQMKHPFKCIDFQTRWHPARLHCIFVVVRGLLYLRV